MRPGPRWFCLAAPSPASLHGSRSSPLHTPRPPISHPQKEPPQLNPHRRRPVREGRRGPWAGPELGPQPVAAPAPRPHGPVPVLTRSGSFPPWIPGTLRPVRSRFDLASGPPQTLPPLGPAPRSHFRPPCCRGARRVIRRNPHAAARCVIGQHGRGGAARPLRHRGNAPRGNQAGGGEGRRAGRYQRAGGDGRAQVLEGGRGVGSLAGLGWGTIKVIWFKTQPWAGLLSTSSGCLGPHPTWP